MTEWQGEESQVDVPTQGFRQGFRSALDLRKWYSVLLMAVLWEALARIIGDALFLPTLSSVIVKFWEMLATGMLTRHVSASLGRALVGFALAAAAGVAIGALMGQYPAWDRFWSPLVSLTYPVPKIGLVPVFILWLGLGEASKLAVILTAAVYPVIFNTYVGMKGVPRVLVWRARTFGATPWEIVRRVVLPHALPHILNGLRLAMGISWIVLFAAEMVAARTGLGYLILYSEQIFETEVVFVALLTIALLGFLFDYVILLISRRWCDWYFRQSAGAGL